MRKDDDEVRAIREMQEMAANYAGPIQKIAMGKRATRTKQYRHIGKYDSAAKKYVPEKSPVWGGGGGGSVDVDVESLA